MDDRETSIAAAIRDLNAGIYTSQRAAAQAYNIPRSTLQERLNGATTSAISHQNQQRLTPRQETFLVEWILEEAALGHPPSHARAREMASRVLRMNGDTAPLGQLWIRNFLRRNPRVASIVGGSTDGGSTDGGSIDDGSIDDGSIDDGSAEASLPTATSPEQIRAFLELFERIRILLGIRTEDIYNMDETGIALGVADASENPHLPSESG